MKTKYLISLFLFLLLSGAVVAALGSSSPEETKEKEKGASEVAFDASTFIMEHLADAHEWHLFTKANGESVAIYLPVILYSKEKGLDLFSSKKLRHGNIYREYKLEEESEMKGMIVSVRADGTVDEANIPLDFSITKRIIGSRKL